MPINTKALSHDVLSNKLALLANFNRFCQATAVFLEAITSEATCSDYRNTLAAGAERDGFDHKVKFVRDFAAILKQGSSLKLLWNLNSVITEAAKLKTYLVKISQTNREIKRRFFQTNIDSFREFCRNLSDFISLSDDSKKSLEHAIGGSALEEIQFQEDLMRLPDDSNLELIRQANSGDTTALKKLRAFFNATEFRETTAVLVDGKLSTSEAALAFIANIDLAKSFTEIIQAVKFVKCTHHQDYLNLCNNTVRLALDDNNAELERQIDEMKKSAEQTEISKLSQSLFARIKNLREDLARSALKINEVIAKKIDEIARFSPALEDLGRNDITAFFSHFRGEFMLELFCLQYKLDEATQKKLLTDFQSYSSRSLIGKTVNYFRRYQTKATDLAANVERQHHAQIEQLQALQARAQKLEQLDNLLFKLELQSQGSLDGLVLLLNRFTEKDRPLFQTKPKYAAFLEARDALVEKLRALPRAKHALDCSTVSQFYKDHLTSGFCLFGGQYRKTRRALAAQLKRPILPSKSSLKLVY